MAAFLVVGCGDGLDQDRFEPGDEVSTSEQAVYVAPVCTPSPSCGPNKCRKSGVCCTPPPANFNGQPFGGMTYTNWTFNEPAITSVTQQICFKNDPGRTTGIYYQLYDFPIDGSGTYHGMQTSSQGRNLIFSRFGTCEVANVRTKNKSGFKVVSNCDASGNGEGASFVSVRLTYSFGVGCYDLRVTRAEKDPRLEADWFDMYVKPAGGTETFAGGIRFPRKVNKVPAAIADGGGSWVEVFSATTSISQIPYSHITLTASAKKGATTRPSVHAEGAYSAIPNSDIFVDANFTRMVHMELGKDTPRCHAAGSIF